MTSFLLSVILMVQVQSTGVVSGVLHDSNGNPVANVRVALAEVSVSSNGTVPGSVLQQFTFSFESVLGDLLYFKAADGSSLRHDCFGSRISNPPQNCYFLVTNTGIVAGKVQAYGMAFHVKDNGRELEFTCQAAQCKVEARSPTSTTRVMKALENGVIPTSSRATFTFTP